MNTQEKERIIIKFKEWFKNSLISQHIKNLKKLKNIDEFNINPFLIYYLANYYEGDSESIRVAKALVYPRALGTSIATSFGTHIQDFIVKFLEDYSAYGSSIPGLDIEFIDQLDGRKKYCQLKAGPNVINKDDVKTIKDHFIDVLRRNKTNRGNIQQTDLALCLIYGEKGEQNTFVKAIEKDYEVYIGKDFWHRFTGDENFYKNLINAAGEVGRETDMKETLNEVILHLSKNLEKKFKDIFD